MNPLISNINDTARNVLMELITDEIFRANPSAKWLADEIIAGALEGNAVYSAIAGDLMWTNTAELERLLSDLMVAEYKAFINTMAASL